MEKVTFDWGYGLAAAATMCGSIWLVLVLALAMSIKEAINNSQIKGTDGHDR